MVRRKQRSSYKGHTVDALALRAEEGRGKLRKATLSCKQAETRRYPNGETLIAKSYETYTEYIGIRGELGELKHLSTRRKRKKTRFPQ